MFYTVVMIDGRHDQMLLVLVLDMTWIVVQ